MGAWAGTAKTRYLPRRAGFARRNVETACVTIGARHLKQQRTSEGLAPSQASGDVRQAENEGGLRADASAVPLCVLPLQLGPQRQQIGGDLQTEAQRRLDHRALGTGSGAELRAGLGGT